MGIYDREYYRDESGSGWLSGTAPVCRALIAVNVAVWLAIQISSLPIVNALGATSEEIFQGGRVYQLLTAAFVHVDLFHILVNMVVLWVFGREVESIYGSRDFLWLYLTAAVFSTLFWAVINTFGPNGGLGSNMIGASGAVMAVFTIYALYYPRREVLLMFILPVPIWLLLVIFIGMDFIWLLQQVQGKPGQASVAFASHLGGAAFGYLYKRYDLRWSRLVSLLGLNRRGLRVYPPSTGRSRPTKSAWLSDREPAPAAAPRVASGVATAPEGELDERLDEILAKIATQGRSALTEEENRILQEASRRAQLKRGGRY